MKICNQVPHATVEPTKEVKEQPKNPKHTGKSYGNKLQLEDDTIVQAPLELDLPARDVLQEDIPPAQELLDHGEDPFIGLLEFPLFPDNIIELLRPGRWHALK